MKALGLASTCAIAVLTAQAPAWAQLAPEPVSTVLGQPIYDRELAALVIPYEGTAPMYRLTWRSREVAELTFPGSTLRPPVPARGRPEVISILADWASVPEDATNPPRVLLTVIGATDVRVLDDATRGRLVVRPKSIPESRTPLPVFQHPVAAGSVLALGFSGVTWAENYPAGESDTRLSGVPTLHAQLALPAHAAEATWWAFEGRLRALSLSFQDRLLPLSLHNRLQFQTEAWLGPHFAGGDWRLRLGAGAIGVFTQGVHSGAPPVASYNFFAGRQIAGPLLGSLGIKAFDGWLAGWRLTTEANWAPALLAFVDSGLPGLPLLGYGAAELGLERDLGTLNLRVGYRAQALYGPGFSETMMGPALTLGGM
ncbi:MAG: hypothetical protein VKP62_11515 [Candidatus Sericytochromatia bacterium]|nr:hypothetical protein [Candidatus Sericytochromatia bacterium]